MEWLFHYLFYTFPTQKHNYFFIRKYFLGLREGSKMMNFSIDMKNGDFKLMPDNDEHKKYPQIGKCVNKDTLNKN